MENNGVVEARGVNSLGRVSSIVRLEVTNIYNKFGTISGYGWGTALSDTNRYYNYDAFNRGNHIVSVDLEKLKLQGYRITKMGIDSKINPDIGKSDRIKPPNGAMNIGLINIGEPSTIEKIGAYMRNSSNNNYIHQGNNGQINVVTSIPMSMAMIVNIKSPNPQINLSITGGYNSDNITFTKYNLKNNLIDHSSKQTIALNSSSTVFTNKQQTFDLKPGNKYIIVYSIIPNKSKVTSININARVDNENTSQNVKLNIQNLPKAQ